MLSARLLHCRPVLASAARVRALRPAATTRNNDNHQHHWQQQQFRAKSSSSSGGNKGGGALRRYGPVTFAALGVGGVYAGYKEMIRQGKEGQVIVIQRLHVWSSIHHFAGCPRSIRKGL